MPLLRLYRTAMIAQLAASALSCTSDEERFQEHMDKAEVYRQQEQVREAALELRQALKLQPQSALVNERLANLYRESRQFENAVFFYREAQTLDPQRVDPLLGDRRVQALQ